MLRATLMLLLTIFLCGTISAGKITFDDLYSIPSYDSPRISPDGTQIVFALTITDLEKNSRECHLYIMDADGGHSRQLTNGPTDEWSPQWAPDGKFLLFLSDRSGSDQVWILPTDGGEARQVTSLSTGVTYFACFPTGQQLLVGSRVFPDCHSDSCNNARLKKNENRPIDARVYDNLLFRHYRSWDDGRVSRLFVVSIHNSTLSELYCGTYDAPSMLLGGYSDVAISPDGGEIIFTMCREAVPAVYVNNDLYTMRVAGGEPEQLTYGEGLESLPRYSADGRFLAYGMTARAGYESDQRDIVLYDRKDKTHTNLTADFDRSINELVWGPKGKYIYFSTIDRGFTYVGKIEASTGKITKLLDKAAYYGLQVSPDGRYLVLARSLSNEPYELCRYDLDSEQLTRLTHFTEPTVADIPMNPAEDFYFIGAMDDSIHGFITLPPDFDKSKNYPLVLLIHGGPQWCWLGNFNYYGWNTQLMAAQGYVVAQIDPHGSVGYGLEFKEYVSGHWGLGDFEDLMKGVDYLIDTYPFIDSTRMGALGRSYGGFMINWICGHTDRFKCLVSIDGTFNHFASYGSTDELWFPEWEYNGTPWSNPEEYRRSSPMTYAENFKTPTMVVHGQYDYRVDLSEGLQMFTALQRMGVPSRLVYFPNEGHSVGGLANLRFVYDRQFEWLAQWLKK